MLYFCGGQNPAKDLATAREQPKLTKKRLKRGHSIPRSTTKKLVLDNDAASRLLGDERHREVVLQFRADVAAGDLILLLSHALLSELSGLASRDGSRFQRVCQELRELSKGRIMRFVWERIPMEAKRRGPLRYGELFLGKKEAVDEWDELVGLRGTQELDDKVYKRKRDVGKFMEEAAKETMTRFRQVQGVDVPEKQARKKLAQVTREWFGDDWRGVVRDWCSDDIAEGAFDIRARGGRLEPEKIPSLWNYKAFQLANLRMVHGEYRSSKTAAQFDAFCYADGAYADLLVTDDRRFRKTSQFLYGNEPDCISLSEFIDRYLRGKWP